MRESGPLRGLARALKPAAKKKSARFEEGFDDLDNLLLLAARQLGGGVKRLLQAALGDCRFLRCDAEQNVDADAKFAGQGRQDFAARRRAGQLPKSDVGGVDVDLGGELRLGEASVLAEGGEADGERRASGFGHGRIILDVFKIWPGEGNLSLHYA